jgi:hypothetical protein
VDRDVAYFTVDEAARALRVTPQRVRELLLEGELEGIPPDHSRDRDWRVIMLSTAGRDLSSTSEPVPAPPEPAEPSQPPVPEPEAQNTDAETSATEADSGEPLDESPGETAAEGLEDAGRSGWTTTKQAAKVLGVSRRSVQGYVRRGTLDAREEGEGVNKTFLVSIDSLNALRDRRRREATEAANFAGTSAGAEQMANLYANTGEALRHAIERVEARTAEATELRIRLEITEKAESTLRAELAEERRGREAAERERDELRRRLADLEEPSLQEPPSQPREYAVTPTPQPGRVGPQAALEGAEETSEASPTPAAVPEGEAKPHPSGWSTGEGTEQRPWWRRLFGG